MATISEIHISKLTNGAYFTFMQYVLQAAQADETVSTECKKQVERLAADFKVLDEAMLHARGSEKTKLIIDADDERDKAWREMRDMLQLMLTFPNAAFQVAAQKVKRVFDTYKVDPKAQRDRETGMMTNLLQELQGPVKGEVELLGLTPVVEEMKRNNDLVFNLTAERAGEESKRVTEEVVNARKACDKSFGALRTKVNSYADWFEDGKMEDFILYLNNQIIRFKRQALKQTAKSPEGTPEDPLGPEGEGGSDGDSTGGSGSENEGGNADGNTGGSTDPNTIIVTFKYNNGTEVQRPYPIGTIIRKGDGNYPAPTPGYNWSGFGHTLTRDITFTELSENLEI